MAKVSQILMLSLFPTRHIYDLKLSLLDNKLSAYIIRSLILNI